MNLFQLSKFWWSIILIIIVIRAVIVHYIPKLFLCVLWIIMALCLLITLFFKFPLVEFYRLKNTIWLIGLSIGLFSFLFSYVRYRKKLKQSIPNKSLIIQEWITLHKLIRNYEVRMSAITFPSSFGILHPVILLPQNFNLKSVTDIQNELAGQYMRIRCFDPIIKLLFALVLCIYWFNPLMWIMYILANRDMDSFYETYIISNVNNTEKFSYAIFLIRKYGDKNSNDGSSN